MLDIHIVKSCKECPFSHDSNLLVDIHCLLISKVSSSIKLQIYDNNQKPHFCPLIKKQILVISNE